MTPPKGLDIINALYPHDTWLLGNFRAQLEDPLTEAFSAVILEDHHWVLGLDEHGTVVIVDESHWTAP